MDKPPTTFQTRVYDVVRTIPRGSVRTYGSIATGEENLDIVPLTMMYTYISALLTTSTLLFLASPTELSTSARAVGTAMGKKAYELKDVP